MYINLAVPACLLNFEKFVGVRAYMLVVQPIGGTTCQEKLHTDARDQMSQRML